MQVQNQQFWKDIPFDKYLSMPGLSYSGIKNEDTEFFKPSTKMQLGTSVHDYLLTPAKYNHDNNRLVKPIVSTLTGILKPVLTYLQPELAITADFCQEGFIMPYKGRIDLCIPGKLVIDIKVTELDINKTRTFFGYDNQLSGYALGIGAAKAFIISIHPKTLQTQITNIPITPFWWEQEVKKRGKVCQTN